MIKLLKKLRKNEDGATAIEYGLIAALIAIALITVLGNVGTALSGVFTDVEGELNTVAGAESTTTTP